MSDNDTASRLRGLIVEYSGIEAGKVTDEAKLLDDIGLDSLDKVEVVMAAEEEFDIEIGDDEGKAVETFGQCVQLVDSKL